MPGQTNDIGIAVDDEQRVAFARGLLGEVALSLYDADGELEWTIQVGGFDPVVAFDAGGGVLLATTSDESAALSRFAIDGTLSWTLSDAQPRGGQLVTTPDGGVWLALAPNGDLGHVSSTGEIDGTIELSTPQAGNRDVWSLAPTPDGTDLLVSGQNLVGGNGGESAPWVQRVGVDGTQMWLLEIEAHGLVAGDCDTFFTVTGGGDPLLAHFTADGEMLWSAALDFLPWLTPLHSDGDELLVYDKRMGVGVIERFGFDGSQSVAPLEIEQAPISAGDFAVLPGGAVWVGRQSALDFEAATLSRHLR